MATLESIQAANTQLIADVAEEKAEVAAKLNTVATSLSTLEATIVTLQAQIAANAGSATPEQLDGVLDGIQAAGRAVRDIYTPAPVVPA